MLLLLILVNKRVHPVLQVVEGQGGRVGPIDDRLGNTMLLLLLLLAAQVSVITLMTLMTIRHGEGCVCRRCRAERAATADAAVPSPLSVSQSEGGRSETALVVVLPVAR
jgi:hypothetical protein